MMLDAQDAAYGDGLDPRYRHSYMWAVKPHYFTPFYNYPYTFGLLFGIGLYAEYAPIRSASAPATTTCSRHRDGRRRDPDGPVRLRCARPRVLGVEPGGDRRHIDEPRTTGRNHAPRVTDLDDRLASRRRPTLHRLGLLVASRDRMTIEPPWDYTQLVLDATT